MKIRLVCVGKNKDRFVEDAVSEFEKKIRPLATLEMVYVKDSKGDIGDNKIRQEEYARLGKYVKTDSYTVLLDVHGKRLSTEVGAMRLRNLEDFRGGNITFLIGGAYGVDQKLKESCSEVWSLSDFTFSHQLARVVLLEQMFRMLTLLRGIPYHK